MKFIASSMHRLMPWKNGKGMTREVAIHPEGSSTDSGDFAWRISIADIPADGPFSTFPGIDRTLLLLQGNGMTLTIDGESIDLAAAFDGVDFKGESQTECRLWEGPTRDFNIMTQQERATHSWKLHTHFPHSIASDASTTLLTCLRGEASISCGDETVSLEPLDSVITDQSITMTSRDPESVVLEVRILNAAR